MVDDEARGCRPALVDSSSTDEALAACPGVGLEHEDLSEREGLLPELLTDWGPVLQIWEGHAADEEIRYRGSSGGVATALTLYALEHLGFHGALHITARRDTPILNETVLSTSREEMLEATGSRYAPASPCDGLQQVEDAPAPCVFIGKPCDVGGARNSATLRPALQPNLGLTIGIFCAGTPSTKGTLEMLRRMGFEDTNAVRSVRYRGNGWPGWAEVTGQGPDGPQTARLSYQDSWGGILQRYRQWRCYVCADHTAEFADVSVGDPWRTIPEPEALGESLVLARTERGRQCVQQAISAGHLRLHPVDAKALVDSQPNLLRSRGAVWGRSWACRALGVAAPRYRNLSTFGPWLRALTLREKAQSIYGTAKRVFTKRLRQRATLAPPRETKAAGGDRA